MVSVHHTGHTIETETVKHVDVHVEAKVGEEESQDLVVTIVEKPRVPELVTSSAAFVEVKVVCAVEVVDAMKSVAVVR